MYAYPTQPPLRQLEVPQLPKQPESLYTFDFPFIHDGILLKADDSSLRRLGLKRGQLIVEAHSDCVGALIGASIDPRD